MKILTLVWSIGAGGTERAAVNYAIGYRLFGCDSKVLVLGKGYDRLTQLEKYGVEVVLFEQADNNSSSLLDYFQQWAPQIIHIHTFSSELLYYIKKIAVSTTKIVETNVFSRPLYQDIYRHVHLSLQLTSWGYWRYERRMRCAHYRPASAVIPYIVDVENFKCPDPNRLLYFRQHLNIPNNAFLIGRIGQAHPSKWDKRLIDIIRQTVAPDNCIYYILVGVPPALKNALSFECAFLKSRIILIDHISGDDALSVFYHSLDCFAHISTIGESFGYVLAEAAACSVPIVTMLTPLRDNGQFEVAGEGSGSFCVLSTKDFVNAIFNLYQNKLKDSSCTSESDRITELFSFNQVIPRMTEIYNCLLQHKKFNDYYEPAKIERIFNFYLKGRYFLSVCVRIVNTSFFYRLTRFWKK